MKRPPLDDDGGSLRLGNCPFHPLAAEASELVCAMNQAFLAGYLAGLQLAGVEAILDPSPGEWCVVLSASTSPAI